MTSPLFANATRGRAQSGAVAGCALRGRAGRDAAAACVDGEHENPRSEEAADQIPKARGEGVRARYQESQNEWADEAAEVAHGINQADGGRGSRPAEKLVRQGPEDGLEGVIRCGHQGEEKNGERQTR